jgi:hypothetical protein
LQNNDDKWFYFKSYKLIHKIEIQPTKTTLGILFDPNTHYFRFYGVSYPTNPITFFQPLIDWVDEYLSIFNNENITIDLHITYFNTSSSTYLFRIMEQFDAVHKKNKNVVIGWYYDIEDDDVLESWNSLISELDLTFELIKAS